MKRTFLLYIFVLGILSNISAQSTYTPIPFTPTPYTPPESKSNEYLMRSLERRERRAKDALEAIGELVNKISEITTKLYPEKNQMEWWKNLTDSLYNNAQELYDTGNYQLAYDWAMEAKSKLYDSEIYAHVHASEIYFEFLKSMKLILEQGRISDLTYTYWIVTHPFKFIPICSDDGKIITGRVEGCSVEGYISIPNTEEIPWQTHKYRATEYCKPKKPTLEKIRMFVEEVVPYQSGQPYMEYNVTKWHREFLVEILSLQKENTDEVQQLKNEISLLDSLLLQDNEYIGAHEYFVRKLYFLCNK